MLYTKILMPNGTRTTDHLEKEALKITGVTTRNMEPLTTMVTTTTTTTMTTLGTMVTILTTMTTGVGTITTNMMVIT